jgi:hypothetical protein
MTDLVILQVYHRQSDPAESSEQVLRRRARGLPPVVASVKATQHLSGHLQPLTYHLLHQRQPPNRQHNLGQRPQAEPHSERHRLRHCSFLLYPDSYSSTWAWIQSTASLVHELGHS